MPVVAIMGRPGSGKSTIGRFVASLLGWRYLSTGDLARQIERDLDLDFLSAGGFAPEDEMRRRVKDFLQRYGNVVLDGMPRRKGQGPFLLSFVDRLVIVHVDVSEEVAIARLKARRRSDDVDAIIQKRMRDYYDITLPALAEIEGRCPVIHVDGHGDPLDVAKKVRERVVTLC